MKQLAKIRIPLEAYHCKSPGIVPIHHLQVTDDMNAFRMIENCIGRAFPEVSIEGRFDTPHYIPGIYFTYSSVKNDVLFVAIYTVEGKVHFLCNDTLFTYESLIRLGFRTRKKFHLIIDSIEISEEWTTDECVSLPFMDAYMEYEVNCSNF